MPGDPVEDLSTSQIGIVVSYDHTADTVLIASGDFQWEAPVADTVPYAVWTD